LPRRSTGRVVVPRASTQPDGAVREVSVSVAESKRVTLPRKARKRALLYRCPSRSAHSECSCGELPARWQHSALRISSKAYLHHQTRASLSNTHRRQRHRDATRHFPRTRNRLVDRQALKRRQEFCQWRVTSASETDKWNDGCGQGCRRSEGTPKTNAALRFPERPRLSHEQMI